MRWFYMMVSFCWLNRIKVVEFDFVFNGFVILWEEILWDLVLVVIRVLFVMELEDFESWVFVWLIVGVCCVVYIYVLVLCVSLVVVYG